MTNADTSRINWPTIVRKRLLPELPNFAAQGRLLYERPLEALLRGFYLDVSGFNGSVAFVHSFVMPLYVPHQHLVLDLGKRLRMPVSKRERWEVNSDDVLDLMANVLKSEGMSFLETIQSPGDLARKLGTELGSLENPHTIEALAYSQILQPNLDSGARTLSKLQASLDLSIQWQREMRGRVDRILTLASTGKFEDLNEQFAEWRHFSMANLKIS